MADGTGISLTLTVGTNTLFLHLNKPTRDMIVAEVMYYATCGIHYHNHFICRKPDFSLHIIGIWCSLILGILALLTEQSLAYPATGRITPLTSTVLLFHRWF